jgi:hypothetical protein
MNKFYTLDLQLFADGAGETSTAGTESNVEETTIPQEEKVSKGLFDKTSAELARYKKMYQAKLTDEEKSKIKEQELQNELEELRREKKHSSIVAGLSKTDLDEKTIGNVATAFVEGDIEGFTKTLIKGLKDALKVKDDEIQRLQLEATERPSQEGSNPVVYTREDVSKMSIEEKQKLFNENPEFFKSLYK